MTRLSSLTLPPPPPQLHRPPPPRMILEHPSGMSVELLDWMGNDLAIVNAARVSLGKESSYDYYQFNKLHNGFVSWDEYRACQQGHFHPPLFFPEFWFPCLRPADAALLNYLMRERHGTPFEMVQFKFRVKAPIGVIWEWVRHRIASYNVMSTRYVDWDKDWYTPEAEDWRKQIGKVGNYQFTDLHNPEISDLYTQAMEAAFDYYGMLLEKGLAREVARNVLPMGSMTQMIWSVNLRSAFNFLSLRTAPNALREIQICARFVEELSSLVTPEAIQLWRRHGKQTP